MAGFERSPFPLLGLCLLLSACHEGSPPPTAATHSSLNDTLVFELIHTLGAAVSDSIGGVHRAQFLADGSRIVVSRRDGADSIRAVLQDSGLTRLGERDPEGLSLLKTFAVPTILELDGSGKVSSVANPEFGNWPPRAVCDRG